MGITKYKYHLVRLDISKVAVLQAGRRLGFDSREEHGLSLRHRVQIDSGNRHTFSLKGAEGFFS